MKKIDFLIRSLYDKNLTAKQLTDLYYEKCQDDIDKKRQYYIDKEIETNIQQKIQEEMKNRTPQTIPPTGMPSGSGAQGAPCSSEAECRAMFGGGPPTGTPQ
jgi:hypothetical protein